MTDKVAREMTFEEEAKLYKEETAEFLKSETVDSEPPFVNSILRRGNRIIRKASDEIERLQSENTRLKAERDKAQKCIYDIETYLELGSGKYIKQVIDGYNKKPCIHFKNLDECACNNKPDDYGQCIYENGIEPKNPSAKCKYYETAEVSG